MVNRSNSSARSRPSSVLGWHHLLMTMRKTSAEGFQSGSWIANRIRRSLRSAASGSSDLHHDDTSMRIRSESILISQVPFSCSSFHFQKKSSDFFGSNRDHVVINAKYEAPTGFLLASDSEYSTKRSKMAWTFSADSMVRCFDQHTMTMLKKLLWILSFGISPLRSISSMWSRMASARSAAPGSRDLDQAYKTNEKNGVVGMSKPLFSWPCS
mmetsp:Transcript_150/g.302  ORF Transcript_150/g.302 Transcript_150/m.302 type:complete len:212 (+) Transcript_150:641-1276(+)